MKERWDEEWRVYKMRERGTPAELGGKKCRNCAPILGGVGVQNGCKASTRWRCDVPRSHMSVTARLVRKHAGRVAVLDAVGPGGAEGELGACTPFIILNSFSVVLPRTMPNCTTLSHSTSPPSEWTKKASWSTTIGKRGTLTQGLLVLF